MSLGAWVAARFALDCPDRAPTLVVASGKDHSKYMNTAQQVARLIPNAKVMEMAQVRHWPAFGDPETFNAAALRFLRG